MMQVHSNGVLLEFDTFGAPTAEPLLLISGLNTPMTRWTPEFCEQLSHRGFYVIRFDNRDCGLSSHFDGSASVGNMRLLFNRITGYPVKTAYTLYDMVDDAIGLLDSLGIEGAHVVGRSMGGMIAQLLAYRYPERTRSLTAIMSSTGNRRLPMPGLRVMKHLIARKPNPQKDLDGYLNRRIAYTQAIGSPRFPFGAAYIRTRVLEDIKRGGFHPGAGRRQFAALLAVGDLRPMIRKLHVPTLVIHGDSDALVPLKSGLDIFKNIPGARIKIIQDMGHALQPEFYDQLIKEIATQRCGQSSS